MTARKPEPKSVPLQPILQLGEAKDLKPDKAQRLEILKQQKELERKERESAMWREASRLPRLNGGQAQTGETAQKGPSQPTKNITGFFAKLRLGKLLE